MRLDRTETERSRDYMQSVLELASSIAVTYRSSIENDAWGKAWYYGNGRELNHELQSLADCASRISGAFLAVFVQGQNLHLNSVSRFAVAAMVDMLVEGGESQGQQSSFQLRRLQVQGYFKLTRVPAKP